MFQCLFYAICRTFQASNAIVSQPFRLPLSSVSCPRYVAHVSTHGLTSVSSAVVVQRLVNVSLMKTARPQRTRFRMRWRTVFSTPLSENSAVFRYMYPYCGGVLRHKETALEITAINLVLLYTYRSEPTRTLAGIRENLQRRIRFQAFSREKK